MSLNSAKNQSRKSQTRPPTYRRHKSTGQAVVTIRLADGKRRDIYLGPWNSKKSHSDYARIIAECVASNSKSLSMGRQHSELTVNEIILAFLRHATNHYRHADGTQTSEYRNFIFSVRPLRQLYGFSLACEFGPLSLKAVREQFIQNGMSRKPINQAIGRIKRIFKWATSEELVPPSVFHGLQTVSGLQIGRTAAKETAPIAPVDEKTVESTLPFLPRHVAGLVRFQLATGCRPSEACTINRAEIDSAGSVWHFRPSHHKLAYRGKSRVIAIGPKAQSVLNAFPTDKPDDFIFSPILSMAEVRDKRAENRKTPRWKSHMERNKLKRKKAPNRAPAERYTHESYARAVKEGVRKANSSMKKALGEGKFESIPHWHPNQLRHTHATKVRAMFGLEAAQVTLGHASADITQIYAERNTALAAEVAAKIG